MEPLREELIRIAEKKINELKSRADRLEAELTIVWEELDDARSTLHFLKTGKTELPEEHKKKPASTTPTKRYYRSEEEIRDWIVKVNEFTTRDFEAAFGYATGGGMRMLNHFEERGIIEVIYPGGRGDPRPKTYKYVHPNRK